MRLIQYIVLLILVLNGLQPLMQEQSVDQATLIALEHSCPNSDVSDDPEQKEDENIDSRGDEDLVTNDDSQVIEPKPNDLQTSSKVWSGQPVFLTTIPTDFGDWVIIREYKVAKISLALKKHSYFSKRTADYATA